MAQTTTESLSSSCRCRSPTVTAGSITWEIGDKALIAGVSTEPGISATSCNTNGPFYGRIERINLQTGARTVVVDEYAQGYSVFDPSPAQPGDTTPPDLTVSHSVDGQSGWKRSRARS